MFLRSSALRARSTSRLKIRTFTSTATCAGYTHAVIGDGGVVGRAIAWKLAQRDGTSTILLEKRGNGGDVPPRSPNLNLLCPLDEPRHDLCRQGSNLLEQYCEAHTLLSSSQKAWALAHADDLEHMDMLYNHYYEYVDRDILSSSSLPEHLKAVALVTPDVPVHQPYSDSLLSGYEKSGGKMALDTEVTAISPHAWSGEYVITTFDHETYQSGSVEAEMLVNAAGLGSGDFSTMLTGDETKQEFLKASWYRYEGTLVDLGLDGNLDEVVLSCPDTQSGYGQAVTLKRIEGEDGGLVVGPVYEVAKDRYDTAIDASEDGIEKLIKRLEILVPDMSVHRTKFELLSPSTVVSGNAFSISGEQGYEGFIRVAGVESADMRCSLAVAEKVDQMLYPLGGDEGEKKASKKGWFGLW